MSIKKTSFPVSNANLVKGNCVPCEGSVDPMGDREIVKYLSILKEKWEVSEDSKSISRVFKLRNFKDAISFVNKVAEVAEEQGHHPDITIKYNKVKISLSTHSISGLSTNDFILASKVEILQVK